MERVDVGGRGRDVEEHGSRGVRWIPLAEAGDRCSLGQMCFEPGGIAGMHPTVGDQLFLVVEGSGWVRVGGEAPVALSTGEAVVWRAGEQHESGSDEGMTVIIAEAPTVEVDPP